MAVSALLVVGLGAVYWLFRSQLALAEAADSLLDVFTAGILVWTVSVAARPEDEDHPYGHSRAEPIGALVAAIIAGVLAFEVVRSSIMALVANSPAVMHWTVAAAFAAKLAIKFGIMIAASAGLRLGRSPAIRALMVDARNDVLVCLVALAGFLGARYGWGMLDAWLALPIGVWIAYAGFDLARENVRFLMGEAPPRERQAELTQLCKNIPGVIDAHDLRAQYLGTRLSLHVHVIVDQSLSVREAHDIGEAVRLRLEDGEDDVVHCAVHIDIE